MKRPVFEHCPLLIPALCLAIGIALGDHIPHGVPMLPVLLAAIAVTLLQVIIGSDIIFHNETF